jgi:hypothetical protein
MLSSRSNVENIHSNKDIQSDKDKQSGKDKQSDKDKHSDRDRDRDKDHDRDRYKDQNKMKEHDRDKDKNRTKYQNRMKEHDRDKDITKDQNRMKESDRDNYSENDVNDNDNGRSFNFSENNLFGIGNNSAVGDKTYINNNKKVEMFGHSDSHQNYDNNNPIINNLKFSNINFADIQANETNQFLVNNNQVQDGGLNLNSINADINPIKDNNMFVTLSDSKFKFFDENKRSVGEFSVDHIMKYVGDPHDYKKQFMKHLNGKEYTDARYLIKNVLCEIEYDSRIKYANINIKNHTQSPFMGDVEMIINLNNLLSDFEKGKLYTELNYVDQKNRGKVEQLIKQFNYSMLNYTIGLVNIVNDQIKDDPTKEELKKQLMMYSTNTVSKISNFVQSQLNTVVKNNEKLEKMMFTSIKLKSLINDKLDKLSNQLNKPIEQKQDQYRDKEPQLGGKSDNYKDITLSSLDSNDSKNRVYNENSYESTIELSHSVDNLDYNYSDDESCGGSIDCL